MPSRRHNYKRWIKETLGKYGEFVETISHGVVASNLGQVDNFKIVINSDFSSEVSIITLEDMLQEAWEREHGPDKVAKFDIEEIWYEDEDN